MREWSQQRGYYNKNESVVTETGILIYTCTSRDFHFYNGGEIYITAVDGIGEMCSNVVVLKLVQ